MSAAKHRPIDTIGGLIDRVQAIRQDARKTLGKQRRQCPEVYCGKSGTIVFCTHDEGHEGPHKGFRKTWTTPSGGADK